MLLPSLHPGQQEVAGSTARFKVVVCGRRWGKTDLGVNMCIDKALASPNKRYAWIAPIYPQAKIGWHELRYLASHVPGVKIKDGDLEVEFANGSTVITRSAHDPDSLRGEGLDGVVLEEAAYLRSNVWHEIVRPMLADRRGWALFISTPAGRNWFAELYDHAVLPDGHNRPGWERWQFATGDNPRISPDELEEARQSMPTLVYSQEHLAQFVDKLGALFKADWMRYYAIEWDGPTAYVVLYGADGQRRHKFTDMRIWAAADIASSLKQTADYTAIVVAAETPHGDLLVLDVRRERLEQPELLDLLVNVQRRWGPEYIGIEKAAAGLGVIQHASRVPGMTILPLDAKGDKLQRATPVAMRMRAGKVFFDASASWLRDLEQEMLNFPEGAHDDQVDALAYCALDGVRAASGLQIRVLD